jgi:hypothetical protein
MVRLSFWWLNFGKRFLLNQRTLSLCLPPSARQAKAAVTSTRKMFVGRLLQAREIEISDAQSPVSSSSSSSSVPSAVSASDARFFDAGCGPFNRAWLQGVVAEVLTTQLFVLDDGTGRISVRSRAAVAVGSFFLPTERNQPLSDSLITEFRRILHEFRRILHAFSFPSSTLQGRTCSFRAHIAGRSFLKHSSARHPSWAQC